MPSAPSVTDQRRLRDGANALDVSSRPAETIDEIRRQLDVVVVGIAALQSLDDLGPEANERASRDQQLLWKRMKALKERLIEEILGDPYASEITHKELEEKAMKP